MSADKTLAARVVRRWVRLYTAGLPPETGQQRRAEMDSDLFEHETDAERSVPIGAEILLRGLLGIPSDLSWRLDQARPGERLSAMLFALLSRAEALANWIVRRGLPGLTSLLLWAYIAGGVLLIGRAPFESTGQAGFAVIGAWGILAGLAMRWARKKTVSNPVVGFFSLFAAAVPLGLLLTATVVAPLMAIVVALLEGRRAWRLRSAMKRAGPFFVAR